MKFLLSVFWLTVTLKSISQQGLSPAVISFDAVRSVTGADKDIFSAASVQALLAGFQRPVFGIRAFQPVGYAGMGTYILTGVIPGKPGNMGLTLNHRGYGGWQETLAGIGFGKKLWDGFSAGIKINAHRVAIASYGTDYSFPVELSAIYSITSSVRTILYVDNPIGVKLLKSGARLSRTMAFGFGYQLSDQVAMGLLLAVQDGNPLVFQGTLMYKPGEKIHFTVAGSVLHGPMAMSAAFRIRKFKIEISFFYQTHLGITGGTAIQSSGDTGNSK